MTRKNLIHSGLAATVIASAALTLGACSTLDAPTDAEVTKSTASASPKESSESPESPSEKTTEAVDPLAPAAVVFDGKIDLYAANQAAMKTVKNFTCSWQVGASKPATMSFDALNPEHPETALSRFRSNQGSSTNPMIETISTPNKIYYRTRLNEWSATNNEESESIVNIAKNMTISEFYKESTWTVSKTSSGITYHTPDNDTTVILDDQQRAIFMRYTKDNYVGITMCKNFNTTAPITVPTSVSSVE